MIYLALEFMAIDFIASIAAVILVVASPSRRDALAVGALELALGALPVLACAGGLGLIATVAAVVGEVAEPLFRHAAIIGALEFGVGVAFRTSFGALV